MRWQVLFADLEAQLAAAEAAELAGEVADRSRRELATVRLPDRLRAARGTEITVVVAGLGPTAGRLDAVGADWLLIAPAQRPAALLPLAAVVSVSGLSAAATPGSPVSARLRLGYALRGIARDRAVVRLRLVDGRELIGTIDAVGADFLDLAVHASDEPRRADAVVAAVTVAFGQLAMVQPV